MTHLSPGTPIGGENVVWNRTDSDRQVMLYTLRQDGWRKGQPVMVNDVSITVRADNGSETNIEPIISTILSALSTPSPEAEQPASADGVLPRQADKFETIRARLQKFADRKGLNYIANTSGDIVWRSDVEFFLTAYASMVEERGKDRGEMDVELFDRAWAMVTAIRGGGAPPFLTPEKAADLAAPVLMARLDQRNAIASLQDRTGAE